MKGWVRKWAVRPPNDLKLEDKEMNDLGFFISDMPGSRPADYYLGCLEGSVFMDFDNCEHQRIRLSRISFDGYGCCELRDKAIPMSEIDSRNFIEMIRSQAHDRLRLTEIIRRTIRSNKALIWGDALSEYGLI